MAGYWQWTQDQDYQFHFSQGNINPQLLGTWTPPCLNNRDSLQLEEDVDRSICLHTDPQNYGFVPHPQITPVSMDHIPYRPPDITITGSPARSQPQHLPSGVLTSSSHSLRPQATVFRPSAEHQEHHTLPGIQENRVANGDTARLYNTPSDASFESQTRGERPRVAASSNPGATNRRRTNQLHRLASRHRPSQHHLGQSRNEAEANTCTSQVGATMSWSAPPANYHGWEPGLAPSENIAGWNDGAYTPAMPLQNLQSLVPPPSSGTVSRQATASVTGSTGSFLCSSEGCSKSFNRKSELDHHERYHGQRRHLCTLCSKAFVFSKDLKRHFKTHTPQERHLFCTTVGCQYHIKGFQRNDHLKRHMQNVHGAAHGSR